jgi:putative Mn2+ efflux pump MntP
MLSIATSIDALAVGFSISMLKVSIWIPAVVIGVVAGLFSNAGLKIGKTIASAARISHYAEALGGIVLLGIGLNVLIQHYRV